MNPADIDRILGDLESLGNPLPKLAGDKLRVYQTKNAEIVDGRYVAARELELAREVEEALMADVDASIAAQRTAITERRRPDESAVITSARDEIAQPTYPTQSDQLRTLQHLTERSYREALIRNEVDAIAGAAAADDPSAIVDVLEDALLLNDARVIRAVARAGTRALAQLLNEQRRPNDQIDPRVRARGHDLQARLATWHQEHPSPAVRLAAIRAETARELAAFDADVRLALEALRLDETNRRLRYGRLAAPTARTSTPGELVVGRAFQP